MDDRKLLDFIYPRLNGALSDEGEFNRVIEVLRAQRAAKNSNTSNKDSPITWIVKAESLDHAACLRSAALIEALYTQCGVPVECSTGTDGYGYSDLYRAAFSMNFPAFETLLTKCAAYFIPGVEDPMTAFFCYLDCYNMLPYLKLLLSQGHMLDANRVFYNGSTPLQAAIGCAHHGRSATDPNPDLVRFLIDELHADTTVKNSQGETPLEELIRNEKLPAFESPAASHDWRRRVEETKHILNRDKFAAFDMGGHIRLGEKSLVCALSSDIIGIISKHIGINLTPQRGSPVGGALQ